MAMSATTDGPDDGTYSVRGAGARRQDRLSTETKASTKTTELYVYLAAVAAVVITALMVNQDDSIPGSLDPFGASDALQLIAFLTVGYMLARGLAKSGSREYYTD